MKRKRKLRASNGKNHSTNKERSFIARKKHRIRVAKEKKILTMLKEFKDEVRAYFRGEAYLKRVRL